MLTEGLVTDTVAIQVTREEIRGYCHVIGETNPIFYDTEAAQRAGYADVVLPAAYPVLFWKDIHIPWLEKAPSIIQSKQYFTYKETLTANETYSCQIRLATVHRKRERQFLEHILTIQRGGRTVAASHSTLLLQEGSDA